MPRKKSIRGSASWFKTCAEEIEGFLDTVSPGQTDEHVSWLHNYAVIKLYRIFESLMLDCLIGAINNDTATLSEKSGIAFPKHLTDEVCEYIITGQGYFDFKGRDGLISIVKRYVPDTHYILTVIKDAKHKKALEYLCALRNFAAHESYKSKKAALDAIGGAKIRSSGAWLKRQDRFKWLSRKLKELADDIHTAAPY
jgi:hypothetical protein